MRSTLAFGGLAVLLCLSAGCPKSGLDEDEVGDGETGDGDGDPTDGAMPTECESACAARVDCGLIGADELDDCASTCEADIEAHAKIFGTECGAAWMTATICELKAECDQDNFSLCEDVGMAAYFACTQTVIPELDAMCECLTADISPVPSDPITPKQSCVMDTGMIGLEAFLGDGQACLDGFAAAWGCLADACEDPACAQDPAPDACLCSQNEDAVAAACPNF